MIVILIINRKINSVPYQALTVIYENEVSTSAAKVSRGLIGTNPALTQLLKTDREKTLSNFELR